MVYTICKTVPTEWGGKHYLICTHHFNSRSYINYLMHCNVIKEMPDGRLKIKVFGYRWTKSDGYKIRYVDKYRVRNSDEYKTD